MTDPIRASLERQGFLVLDGGLATELEALGCDLNDPLWSARALLGDREAVRSAHRRFLEAGADCIATATYQATFEGFGARGHDARETVRLLCAAVEVAVSAARRLLGRPVDAGRSYPAACRRQRRTLRCLPRRWVGVPGRLRALRSRTLRLPRPALGGSRRDGGRTSWRARPPPRWRRRRPTAVSRPSLTGRPGSASSAAMAPTSADGTPLEAAVSLCDEETPRRLHGRQLRRSGLRLLPHSGGARGDREACPRLPQLRGSVGRRGEALDRPGDPHGLGPERHGVAQRGSRRRRRLLPRGTGGDRRHPRHPVTSLTIPQGRLRPKTNAPRPRCISEQRFLAFFPLR